MTRKALRLLMWALEGLGLCTLFYVFGCSIYAKAAQLEYSLVAPVTCFLILSVATAADCYASRDSASTVFDGLRILLFLFFFSFLALSSDHSVKCVLSAVLAVLLLVFRMVLFFKRVFLRVYKKGIRRVLYSIFAMALLCAVLSLGILGIRPATLSVQVSSPDKALSATVQTKARDEGWRTDTVISLYKNQVVHTLPLLKLSSAPAQVYYDYWIDLKESPLFWSDESRFCIGSASYLISSD